jgi:hypothetical protein
MKKYYIKYLILIIVGSIIIGLAFYLFLSNYLDKKEIIVASRNLSAGEKINEEDLYFKEYYKNSLPENYLTDKEAAIGNIINIERKKDDYISKEMFDKEIKSNIFEKLSPGEVIITINIQYIEPILRELKIGNCISIISTILEKDSILSENFVYSDIDNVGSNEYLNRNNYFSTGLDYIDSTTFYLSENVIWVDGQIIVRNLEILFMEENINNSNKNILLNNNIDNNTSIYLKCNIKEAPIVARLTKNNDYKIIVENI